MKALVTGATGFIGSHIVDLLLQKGYEVRCSIRKTSNRRWLGNKNIELIETNFEDMESVKKLVEGVDYIYHVAGATFAKNKAEFMKSNLDVTKIICEATIDINPNLTRFIYMSSQAVSGPAESLEKPSLEEMPTNPITAYAYSKLATEEYLKSNFDNLPITIVRAPAVYGPRDSAIFDVFKIINKDIGFLIGFNQKYISLIYGPELARGTLLCGESENSKSEIYFISSDEFYDWETLVETMAKALGRNRMLRIRLPHFLVKIAGIISGKFSGLIGSTPVFNYEKAIDFSQQYWVCSHKKAEHEIGFKNSVSLEEGMKKTVRWYKENKWL